jgi:small nuclear ribonucleoprotein (snRNP)-like protein
MKEKQQEIDRIEYQIRKSERGIRVCCRDRERIYGTSVNYDSMIKAYIKDIRELRDRLEKLTEKKHFSSGRWKILTKGRRQPSIPEWPV